jgi:antitoxin component YwqK of YwqJK toxin-antitoxin module
MNLLITIATTVLMLFTADPVVKKSPVILYYHTGQIREIFHIDPISKKKEGPAYFFNQDGKLLIQTQYAKGKEKGIRKVYLPDMTLSIMYENGKPID